MDWLQFVAAVIGHLAWPVVALIIIFAIRNHLGSLAERILELSFGGATVKFGKLLSKGTEIIDDSPTLRLPPGMSEQPQLPLEPPPKPKLYEPSAYESNHSSEWDGTSPQALATRSIFDAFQRIEDTLDEIGEQLGVKARNGTLMRMLVTRGFINSDLVDLYTALRLARNAMAHGRADLPNEAEAQEYVRQAKLVGTFLRIVRFKLTKET